MAQAPRWWTGRLALLLLLGCGSGSAGRSGERLSPASSDPEATLSRFMKAVRENDLVTMSLLWGTKDGPAVDKMDAVTAERRLRVMQIYLAHEEYSLEPAVGDLLGGRHGESRYRVRLQRHNCTPVVPFKLVLSRGNWLIENVDLAEAGNPARNCSPRGTLR